MRPSYGGYFVRDLLLHSACSFKRSKKSVKQTFLHDETAEPDTQLARSDTFLS